MTEKSKPKKAEYEEAMDRLKRRIDMMPKNKFQMLLAKDFNAMRAAVMSNEISEANASGFLQDMIDKKVKERMAAENDS